MMAGILRGRGGQVIVVGEYFFFGQVMANVDAIAAEPDVEVA